MKKKLKMKKLSVITLCVLMTFGMTYSQNGESKMQKLKNAFQSESFQLSGYGHIQYNISEYPERSLIPGKVNNSIEIVRAVLSASGKVGTKNQFGYLLMYDFSPNAKLFELYSEWLPSRAVNIRFGQFKIPFTLENPIPLTRIETINMSRSVLAMSGNLGDFNQYEPDGKIVPKSGRDAGLQVSGFLFSAGNFFRLEYYAGLFNGTGLNAKDNNNHKDFIGTAYFYPAKAFKLGGSVYSGKYPQYMTEHLQSDNLSTFRWTIGAEYKSARFCSRAEYIAANDGDTKRNGYYGLLLWKCVPDKWEMLGKYDYYNENINLGNNGIHDILFGVNYYFAYLSRIQLNYVYTGNPAVGRNHALEAQLQVFF